MGGGEVEKRERMLKDFAVGLGGPDFDGEHDAFKVLAQFETGKQRPNTAIPIGDHCEAIATLAQGLERGEDVVVNTPGSGLRESLVERVEEVGRERRTKLLVKNLIHQRCPGLE